MNTFDIDSCTLFAGFRRVASGPRDDIADAASRVAGSDPTLRLLIFDDATGRQIDLAPRAASPLAPAAETRGRGRPKLGVVSREITLLPRHWDWLNGQPGGASVVLRKLVDQARREAGASDRQREARDAAYGFMSAMAGDFAGFEEASRALFAGDHAKFDAIIADWPKDVGVYAAWLASGGARN
ncbi:DUF2239 family protein [Rhodoblastus sp. 17X3]|uniref:DUF2239 family protein n=1 Tax=Rhodoblastus sp. 17X3 TaxID=3047026 RepID=UPI0024B76D81|nr:DUF2239 family protein [Rhodoblastus sp. 17X3]MDI9847221.1 DUF2239 family protein [Rhodoblastus sp. 17X3]